jgi:excisionase family DNA binding protein
MKEAARRRQRMEEQLLDLKQASDMLGLSIYTISNWVQKRKIAHVKLGRRVLIKRTDIEALIEKGSVPAREAC